MARRRAQALRRRDVHARLAVARCVWPVLGLLALQHRAAHQRQRSRALRVVDAGGRAVAGASAPAHARRSLDGRPRHPIGVSCRDGRRRSAVAAVDEARRLPGGAKSTRTAGDRRRRRDPCAAPTAGDPRARRRTRGSERRHQGPALRRRARQRLGRDRRPRQVAPGAERVPSAGGVGRPLLRRCHHPAPTRRSRCSGHRRRSGAVVERVRKRSPSPARSAGRPGSPSGRPAPFGPAQPPAGLRRPARLAHRELSTHFPRSLSRPSSLDRATLRVTWGNRMRRAAIWAAALAALAPVMGGSQAASPTWTHGYDVSWRQCSGTASHHLPGGSPAYAILGLTHGTGHTTNPCLPAQVSWVREHGARIGAYLVPSFPTAADIRAARNGPWGACGSNRTCRLRTDGARQAADAIALMRDAGLPLRMLWVDVECRHTPPWTSHDAANRHVLEGVFRGLRNARVSYGIYTTGYMWHAIVGDWRVRVPNWLPAGSGDPAAARQMCRTTATGGRTWLGQYTREWDENLTCPAMDAVPGHPGPLWRYRHTTLRIGSTGAAVTALQKSLKVSASGSYEPQTLAAVTKFQQAHGLPMNGQVDADDWRALGAFRRIGGHPWLLNRMTTR